MRSDTAPAGSSTIVSAATGAAVNNRVKRAGFALALLAGLMLAGCSITIGPQPTPGTPLPGQPTFTPIEQVRVDVTRVPSPTAGAPTATRGPIGAPVEYTIKSGDTLSGIAEEFGVTVDEIVRFNNITDPNSIYEGQVIMIPPPGAGGVPSGGTPGAATPSAVVSATATMVP